MPSFVNSHDHPVRIADENGNLQRYTPGQVVKAEGRNADLLVESGAFETATEEDVQAFDASRRGMQPGGLRIAAKDALSGALLYLRQMTVSGPANVVIGDDAAPVGPPSGTITTKHEVALKGGPREQRAFAPNEAPADPSRKVGEGYGTPEGLPGGATVSQEQVYNDQVDNAVAATQAAQQLIDTGEGSVEYEDYLEDDEGDEGDGSPAESEDQPLEDRTVGSLKAEAERRDVEVEGTGSGGNAVKDDYVKALKPFHEEA